MNNENIRKEIKDFLISSRDKKFREFSSSLCPYDDKERFIGVRTPIIKKYAKYLLKQYNIQDLIENIENDYYEELLLEGLIIDYAKIELNKKIEYVEMFVPKIINWAICDTFCSSFKFKDIERESIWKLINKYKNSSSEFEIRFFVVMMMDHFLIDEYIDDVFKNIEYIARKKYEYYYVKMGIAWLISEAYIKFKNKTETYLSSNSLDDWTQNKSIQKIRESFRVTKEDKEYLKKLKRK